MEAYMTKKKRDSENSWVPEIEELRHRESLAARMGGAENLKRQRDAGRLNIRE